MSCKHWQHLEQSELSGSASQKVLSGIGIGIVLIFPNYETTSIFMKISKIQWIHNNLNIHLRDRKTLVPEQAPIIFKYIKFSQDNNHETFLSIILLQEV